MQIFDFQSNYDFYQSYHGNTVNKWIHIFCIPAIVWSTIILLSNYEFRGYNVSNLLFFFYCFYYLILNIQLALIVIPLLFMCFRNALNFKWSNPDYKWKAWCIFISAWVLQFIGHGVFEGNSPALMDSLVQSFLMAPIFVIKEVISMII